MTTRLFHCFGTSDKRTVDTPLAVEMLAVSGCRHLVANTHAIERIKNGEELPVGYADATVGSVLAAWPGEELKVVLNINHPTSAAEAVERAQRALALRRERIIKLEVLDADHRLSNDAEVLEAATELAADPSLEVWPLVTPNPDVIAELERLGCPMIRVMGSGIGSSAGIRPEWSAEIEAILAAAEVPVMLDGGVGGPRHVSEALRLGFSSVLVNSCLFADGGRPIDRLRSIRAAADATDERLAEGAI